MAEFMIRPQKIQEQIDNIDECFKSIKRCNEDLNGITNKMDGSSDFDKVKKALESVSSDIVNEAANLQSFEKALSRIMHMYISAEEKITGTGTDKRNLFEKILATLNIGDDRYSDSKYYSTTRAQEQLMDEYLKKECIAILDKDEYSEKNWKTSNLKEREKMLTNLIIRLNGILGTNVNTNVSFKRLDSASTRGYYTDSSNTVTINIDYFDPSTADSDSYKIMQTMIHEMRHAYQHSAIDNPSDFVVSEETLNAWENSFHTYKDADDYGYDVYVSQSVEYDAKMFADQKSDVKNKIPDYAGVWE